jgi:hypothetical protein
MEFDKQAAEVVSDAKAHAAAVLNSFRNGSGKLWTVRAIMAELESAYIAGYSSGMRDLTRATDTVQWRGPRPGGAS